MKKALKIIKTVLVWTLVAIAVFMMIFTIVSVATFNKTDRNLFGLKFFVVQTDSMKRPESGGDDNAIYFDAGDIVIVKDVEMEDRQNLLPGDVITFISRNTSSYGETITHAIRKLETDKSGRPLGFTTYGANTGVDDESTVELGDIVGKYVGRIPKLGEFFAFLKTTPGYIVCIFVPIVLLILYNGTNIILLFRKYKKEQTAQMEEERQKIDEERKRSEEMLLELQKLKDELDKKQTTGQAPPAETSAPAEPEKPAEAAAPAEPEKPAEAEAPAEPEKPAEAAAPAGPEKPAEAEAPGGDASDPE